MSSKGQSALSGLRTIKRDWSQTSVQSTEDRISWPATPPTTQPQNPKPSDARSQRMKDIEAALQGVQMPGERIEISTKQIANASRRPLPSALDPPAAKKRQLPSSWGEDTLSSSSNFKIARTSHSSVVKSTPLTVASSASSSSKLAGVFLSQEQTHILRLVEAGNSVFYTGSAGKSRLNLLPSLLLSKHAPIRYWEIGLAPRNHSHFAKEVCQISRCYCYYRIDG
jgi:hypothetical protein